MGLLHIFMADVSFSLTRWHHCTRLHERTSWQPSWNYDVISEIQLCQSTVLCVQFYIK